MPLWLGEKLRGILASAGRHRDNVNLISPYVLPVQVIGCDEQRANVVGRAIESGLKDRSA
jgi:hypothetical protein